MRRRRKMKSLLSCFSSVGFCHSFFRQVLLCRTGCSCSNMRCGWNIAVGSGGVCWDLKGLAGDGMALLELIPSSTPAPMLHLKKVTNWHFTFMGFLKKYKFHHCSFWNLIPIVIYCLLWLWLYFFLSLSVWQLKEKSWILTSDQCGWPLLILCLLPGSRYQEAAPSPGSRAVRVLISLQRVVSKWKV